MLLYPLANYKTGICCSSSFPEPELFVFKVVFCLPILAAQMCSSILIPCTNSFIPWQFPRSWRLPFLCVGTRKDYTRRQEFLSHHTVVATLLSYFTPLSTKTFSMSAFTSGPAALPLLIPWTSLLTSRSVMSGLGIACGQLHPEGIRLM